MAYRDLIVDEIRKIRDEHAAEFNYDLHAICEDYRKRERESGRKYVTLRPKRRKPKTAEASVSATRRLERPRRVA